MTKSKNRDVHEDIHSNSVGRLTLDRPNSMITEADCGVKNVTNFALPADQLINEYHESNNKDAKIKNGHAFLRECIETNIDTDISNRNQEEVFFMGSNGKSRK